MLSIEKLHQASPTLAKRKSRSHQVAVDMREQMATRAKRDTETGSAKAEVFIDEHLTEDGDPPSAMKRLKRFFRKRG